MNILVIGGSYFLGKCFVNMAACEHNVTIFNRGSRPILTDRNIDDTVKNHITELVGDRQDIKALSLLEGKSFDVVVDFCAYKTGDIASIFNALNGSFSQYIFISTVDVYERGLLYPLDEQAAFEYSDFPGPEGEYIKGKVALEKEIVTCSNNYGIAYTVIRPSFIYGPDNYAPREGIYFMWIDKAGQIIHPIDADGEFQMVYVNDVAKAIHASLLNKESYNQAYNLSPIEVESYESFASALEKASEKPFTRVGVTLETVYEKGIPLPFPLTKAESNLYDGRKALSLIGEYVSLREGLKETMKK